MAFTWPTSGMPNPEVFRISPRDMVVGDPSPYTGAREVMVRWHQWHAYIQWNHVTNSDFWGLFGHFNNSQGGRFVFQIPIFSFRAQRGTKSGTVTFSDAHAAGATSITVTGGSGTFARGDWIQIAITADHPSAHVVTSSEVAGVISIHPGLRTAKSGGNSVRHLGNGIIHDSMELADPEFALSIPSPDPGFFQPFSLELVTALRRNP